MSTKHINFLRCVSANWYGKLGVVLVTSSFISLVILELARIFGIITNSYVGLVTYLLFPSLFVVGLILIPIGWLKLKRQTGKPLMELLVKGFDPKCTEGGIFGSRLLRMTAIVSIINVLFLIAISAQMLSFMDEAKFCGTACHSVMNPEWVTYQKSPHARVKCTQCHVGEGTKALVNSKLNGLWQIISVTFDLLERPIPTPVRQLRPARETCEKCHWPDKFYGSRLKTITHYDLDEASTPSYTTLNMKIDAGKGINRAGIHWHIAEENEVRYASVNDEREEIIWTEVRQPDGSLDRYITERLKDVSTARMSIRTMDCVDCHNRATHIYEDPERAIDERIQQGLLNRSLPFLKREALKAITSGYPDGEAAMEGIANHMHGFYQRYLPDMARKKSGSIDSAVSILREIYYRNIHPEMNVTWGAYPSHIGHKGARGCFRCHNKQMVAGQGKSISGDCTLCHSILADQKDNPFQYLLPVDTADRDFQMHRYLREEFLQSLGGSQ